MKVKVDSKWYSSANHRIMIEFSSEEEKEEIRSMTEDQFKHNFEGNNHFESRHDRELWMNDEEGFNPLPDDHSRRIEFRVILSSLMRGELSRVNYFLMNEHDTLVRKILNDEQSAEFQIKSHRIQINSIWELRAFEEEVKEKLKQFTNRSPEDSYPPEITSEPNPQFPDDEKEDK